MPNIAYNITLKGYVEVLDFDRSKVDKELAKNEDKQVNVLIDSLGGSLATGLSISAAFKNHGKVNVHFVGLNASAATIASLGAAHISIDAVAMYLVHKCSMALFEWGSLNSDQFSTLIVPLDKILVQPFTATDDQRVLGIEPIPNINEKISQMIEKYRKETIDIEDVELRNVIWSLIHYSHQIIQPMNAMMQPRIIKPNPIVLFLAHLVFISSDRIGSFFDL